MLLSNSDIERLERAGNKARLFVRFNRQGFAQLRNNLGHCVFYQADMRRCRIYKDRPLGCRIYPVLFSVEEGVVVDDLCPQAGTVSKSEIDLKKARLERLLARIDKEARNRKVKP
jgi:Fe-S-cluster containining protein